MISLPSKRRARGTVRVDDLALGLKVLADLVEAGLPLARALQVFHDLAPSGWADALPHIRQSVKAGVRLGTAIEQCGMQVPAAILGIINAGEVGGSLTGALRRAAQLAESAAVLRSSIRTALSYPALLAAVGLIMVSLMVGVVLPRFASMLAELGESLPRSTQVTLAIAHAARTAVLPTALSVVPAIALSRAWLDTRGGRERWHSLLLVMPIVGRVRAALATARASSTLAALHESRVPLPRALRLAAHATGDAAIEVRLLEARELVTSGRSLSQALADTAAVTSTAVKLIRAGEASGRLVPMLTHIAKLEQQWADRTIRAGLRMLEPTLILLFASVVGGVAAALLQAVYAVRPAP